MFLQILPTHPSVHPQRGVIRRLRQADVRDQVIPFLTIGAKRFVKDFFTPPYQFATFLPMRRFINDMKRGTGIKRSPHNRVELETITHARLRKNWLSGKHYPRKSSREPYNS